MGRERLETKDLEAAGWLAGGMGTRASIFLGAMRLERLGQLREVGTQGKSTSGGMWKSCQGEEPDLRDEKKIVCVYLGVHSDMHRPEDNCECHFSDVIHLDLGTKSLDLDRT